MKQLERAILLIKSMDPQGEAVDVNAIIQPFRKRVDGLMARDPAVIKEVASQLPSRDGLEAQDTVDKLYREQFEALPLPTPEHVIRVR